MSIKEQIEVERKKAESIVVAEFYFKTRLNNQFFMCCLVLDFGSVAYGGYNLSLEDDVTDEFGFSKAKENAVNQLVQIKEHRDRVADTGDFYFISCKVNDNHP